MKMPQSLILLLAGGLLMSGIAAAADQPAAPFTPEMEARIGEIARDYLLAHPEVLLQVSQKLEAQQQAQQVKAMTDAALQQQNALLNDKMTPAFGPAGAKVAVIEFFDYQCIVCARQAPVIEAIMKANPQVRYIFKEWPIFAQRWDASLNAAKTGLQIWLEKGGEAYVNYHNAVYATGHNEGKLTPEDIGKAAALAGKPGDINPQVVEALKRNDALAQKLGLQGTPAMIIMPLTGATADNVAVIPGGASQETLQAAIDRAAAAK